MESFLQPILIGFMIVSSFVKLTYINVTNIIQKQIAQVRCERDGKEFLTWCGGDSYACVKKFSDAGSPCTSTNLICQGFCIEIGKGEGFCSEYSLPKQRYDKYLSTKPQLKLQPPKLPNTPASLLIDEPCTIR